MDYFERQCFLRYLAFGVAEDEIDWTTHDNRYHGGLYDPKTMTCKARRAFEDGDLADLLSAEREEADYKKMSQKLDKELVKRETAERIERKTIAELTSRDYTDEDRKMVDAALRHVMTAKPVEVTMQEANAMMRSLRANKPKDVVANMIRHFESTYPDGIEVPGIGKVEVNRASAKSIFAHATRHSLLLPKFAAISRLKELLMHSVQFGFNKHWKGRSYDSLNFVAPMLLGNQEKLVEFTIIRYSAGRLELYNIKTAQKENVEECRRHVAVPFQEDRGKNFSSTPHSLPNNSQPVNGGLEENLKPPKLPSSNLVRQYLAAHGLLEQYLTKQQVAAQDAATRFSVRDFKAYLKGAQ